MLCVGHESSMATRLRTCIGSGGKHILIIAQHSRNTFHENRKGTHKAHQMHMDIYAEDCTFQSHNVSIRKESRGRHGKTESTTDDERGQ